jgi:F0F1-type ATP synthase delta subunit
MGLNSLLQKISFETFSDVIGKSPRKVRESLYSHYGIKTKAPSVLKSVKDKKQQRVQNLFSILQNAQNPKEQEFLKELFRNWLFHQRPMLKAALDHLGVENDFGLVEIETDFFKELDESKIKQLIATLEPEFPKDAIKIYLTIMEVPHVEKYV